MSEKTERELEQIEIQEKNALNQIKEILEPCINCGLCKSLCPFFRVSKEEHLSPRGQVILLQNKVLDYNLFKCSLCKACEKNCPSNIKICDAIKLARKIRVLRGKELKENQKLVESVSLK